MSDIRSRLKEAAKFGSETVEAIPGSGIMIEIRELSSGKRTAFGTLAQRANEDHKTEDPHGKVYRKLLLDTAHDPETGEKVWTPETASEVDSLPGTLVERLARVAFRVNGLDEEARLSAKNDSVPGEGSSSKLPVTLGDQSGK